ncbi:HD domain-containing protein, partial [Candidatus Saccharibacteria bacterium]|nr:HD domain-containing protein [Candidatus Saccharibacteria bacterium]
MKPERHAKRLLDLQDLLVNFSEIERLIYMPDGKHTDRKETDTEHSYNLAILAWYLCGSFPHLDRDKVIRYALMHDMVEIHAGDVMAIGRTAEQQATKDEREAEALNQLKSEWPDFSDMTDTIEEYEEQKDPEAVFVKALDKITPMMLQILSNGKTWKKYDILRSEVIQLKDEKTAPSKEVNE